MKLQRYEADFDEPGKVEQYIKLSDVLALLAPMTVSIRHGWDEADYINAERARLRAALGAE